MIRRLRAIGYALTWAGLITGSEWLARRSVRNRSTAWFVSYLALCAAALGTGTRLGHRTRWVSFRGLVLATIGYPLGRWLLRDRLPGHPPKRITQELVAIEVVAATEELTWGGIVEPVLGSGITAALFAAKHAVIDGRWRRILGLFLFWIGLSAQRRRWPALALGAHLALNALGVVRGHWSGRDQF